MLPGAQCPTKSMTPRFLIVASWWHLFLLAVSGGPYACGCSCNPSEISPRTRLGTSAGILGAHYTGVGGRPTANPMVQHESAKANLRQTECL
ncbi:hypothetical protein C8Q70DRAFT_950679 [Cubamyces menziesii]|nr:hypothetical protein C8Q70DRAFT_950679 [Cubamyces menziesii]